MRRSPRLKGRLQELWGWHKDWFLDYARQCGPDYSVRYGYDTPEDLWNANPQVEFVD